MDEREFMELAISEMEKSDTQEKVGAVIVVDGEVVATGFKQKGRHAERMAIEVAIEKRVKLRKAVLYTTLEPCINLKPGQQTLSCADFIVQNKIQEVIIGRYDPNPNVKRRGWKRLREGGIHLRDFPADLRDRIDDINRTFVNYFEKGVGPSGRAKIGHKDGGKFTVQFSREDQRHMELEWTVAGINAAYGYAARPVEVALADFAENFDEVDDPTAYDFSHSVRIEVGEIGIFCGPEACVLVKPKEIQSGPKYGTNDVFVRFEFEVRVLKAPTI